MALKKVRSRNPEKEEYAYLLFMQRATQEDICKRVGVTAPTLKSWKDSGSWEDKRASRTISLDDLITLFADLLDIQLHGHGTLLRVTLEHPR